MTDGQVETRMFPKKDGENKEAQIQKAITVLTKTKKCPEVINPANCFLNCPWSSCRRSMNALNWID